MRIGLLLATYNDSDILEKCLEPWIKLRDYFDIKISICHGQFAEYHQMGYEDNDSTSVPYLLNLEKENKIDFVYIQNTYPINNINEPIYQNEAQLRNHGLKYLLDQNVDYFWTIGADEIYTEKQILNIIKYIQIDPKISWYRIHHKNFVFNDFTYIRGFCPARIWNNINYKIDKFYWDDDILYKDNIDYKSLSNSIIPESLAFINHYTWNNFQRSKDKILYQEKHFKSGAGCSFKVNEEKKQIEWNLDYFIKIGKQIPEVYAD